jgi:hypothetical protein
LGGQQAFDGLSGHLRDFELDGRPVFNCLTRARSRTTVPEQMSSTLRRTRSDARSLLSIARLNSAKSRAESDISSRTLIDQTCLGSSGRFCPTMRPLFQARRTRVAVSMASSLPSRPPRRSRERVDCTSRDGFWPKATARPSPVGVFVWQRATVSPAS